MRILASNCLLKPLERENADVKKLVGVLSLDNRMLKDAVGKSGESNCQVSRR